MPDLTPEEVRAMLRSQGLAALDEADLAEVTHRINAINEAVAKLSYPDEDTIEPLPIFWLTEEEPWD